MQRLADIRVRATLQWMSRVRWVRLVLDTLRGFQQDNCGQMAAAVAYFSLLSIFPLLLLFASQLPTVLAMFSVHYNLDAILFEIVRSNVSANVAAWLHQSLRALERGERAASVIGLLALVWTASSVFAQIDQSFNRIWRVYDDVGRRNTLGVVLLELLRGRLLAFALVLLFGVIMLTTSVFTAGLAIVRGFFPVLPGSGFIWNVLDWMVAPLLSVLGMGLLYRFLPNTRVLWRDIWLGALVAGLLNEVARGLVGRFIAQDISGIYQSVAGPMALMIWAFFTCQIMFLGCELTRHYALVYGSRSTPDGIAEAEQEEARLHLRGMVHQRLNAHYRSRLGARRARQAVQRTEVAAESSVDTPRSQL